MKLLLSCYNRTGRIGFQQSDPIFEAFLHIPSYHKLRSGMIKHFQNLAVTRLIYL